MQKSAAAAILPRDIMLPAKVKSRPPTNPNPQHRNPRESPHRHQHPSVLEHFLKETTNLAWFRIYCLPTDWLAPLVRQGLDNYSAGLFAPYSGYIYIFDPD
ncbi:hypothetical protein BDV06DRAFT_133238 [Aspergillus oleicola]